MRGLKKIPLAIVEKWALDGGGDYRFVEYPNERGLLHGFTYATFRRGDGLVLVGSLDESHGFTLIRTFAAEGRVSLETESPYRTIDSGERVTLGRYASESAAQSALANAQSAGSGDAYVKYSGEYIGG